MGTLFPDTKFLIESLKIYKMRVIEIVRKLKNERDQMGQFYL